MPPPATENPSSQWDAILEYSKGVVTLAAAILGLTVTFSEKILTDGRSGSSVNLLLWSWILLLATILFGVLTSTFVINYLRHGTKGTAAILFVNLSFFALLVASALFLLVGYHRITVSADPDIQQAALGAKTAVAAASNTKPSDWIATSITWNGSTRAFSVELQRSPAGAKYRVTLTGSGRAVNLTQIPP